MDVRRTTDLIADLCRFDAGVVADDNAPLFDRLGQLIPLEITRFRSGDSFNGWLVPDNWRVESATISRNGKVLFDGSGHPLGVARYSEPFSGSLTLEELRPHLVADPSLPDALVFHCMWQYRPWDADWALSVPWNVLRTFEPGDYQVDLRTAKEPGEMLVGHLEHKGEWEETIVFNAHTCHPGMANDVFAGVGLLVELFRWLAERETRYTYRLVLAPEHIGTVFYLRDLPKDETERLVCGVFAEMPGTQGPITVASTFLGGQPIDRAFHNAVRHRARSSRFVPWRQGAGNDETVWEAPGYEVPFVEVTRSEDLLNPYREYHTSLDTPDLMDPKQMEEFYEVLQGVVEILEQDATPQRRFNGLLCLSNPRYNLYMERPDPAVDKQLPEDSEAWGYLSDCLQRYFDGTMSVLDIAERHQLPFPRVYRYLQRFAELGLIDLRRAPMARTPTSKGIEPT
jgi:aminopeptidase-like protein